MKLWKKQKINLGGGYFTNKKKLIVPLLIILAVVLFGTSFALWQLTFRQTGTNVITTGCLKLTLTEETDAINLTDATPTSDEEGKKLEPFTFTLENVCTTETAYVVNLETLSSGDKILADNYVRANLVSGENELFIDNLLETHINEEKVIEEATTAYKLHQGKLKSKEKISFNLRLWMDESTEALDEVMNATWQGKITVTAEYVPPVDTTNMMVAMDVVISEGSNDDADIRNNTYTQNGKYNVREVLFENQIKPYKDAIEVVDFSEAKDRSVLGYYVKNDLEDGGSNYTLYIQADGKIKVNQNGSYYAFIETYCRLSTCYNTNTLVRGIENWDTSLVTDMSWMFFNYPAVDLDLSGFDTTNVTNMNFMFNTASVQNIIYGDKFVHNNNASINNMFSNCPANKPTGSSWNGVTF